MKLLVLSGSLRAASSTNAVLRTALELLPDARAEQPDIAQLPHFNPDMDTETTEPPAPVAALREAAARAEALLVVSPEYVHGVPGSLKNALDWLVSSAELTGTRTSVITGSPAPGGGEFAFAQLRETLTLLTGNVLPTACLAIGGIGPKTDADTGRLTDGAARTSLRHALEALTAPPAAA